MSSIINVKNFMVKRRLKKKVSKWIRHFLLYNAKFSVYFYLNQKIKLIKIQSINYAFCFKILEINFEMFFKNSKYKRLL
jgi:hypothetical protein